MFWFFAHEACRILAPQPGIQPSPPTPEGEVLTPDHQGTPQSCKFLKTKCGKENETAHLFPPFTHSSIYGPLGCFHVLTIVNSAAISMRVQVAFSIMFFSGHMPSSGIAGAYGSSMSRFLKKLYTVFHNGCISLHPNNSARGQMKQLTRD